MTLSQKVDAIIEYLTAADPVERQSMMDKLKTLAASTEVQSQPKDIDRTINDTLIDIGVPAHLCGRQYSASAIKIVLEHPESIRDFIKNIYIAIAKEFKVTWTSVERGIRHAVESACDRAGFDTMQQYFGNTISPNKGKPTNQEFIAQIANIIRSELAKENER